ncbi:uncharacterized protein KY384_005366 [Bacidia gigantensis]|uniref:uncharacterized protein n=1 Tax=Bacidia gigantensis TaxID=2732470 RepID=UPI001D04446C|nr:uncharacterized protein KY384_005366 [Bacidia gigantensis]KAG8529885.1 hypothetical protein KY384_005366 [Bacidia gigantensis]
MAKDSVPTVTVIGSLNTDLVTRTSRVPEGGETLTSQAFKTGSGGKGANQAVACARLSRRKAAPGDGTVKVRMIGAVGDDFFGKALVQDLKDSFIDVSGVTARSDEHTGTAVIIVEESTGENRILLSPGANHGLTPETFVELPAPLPDVIVLQLEIPLETVLQVLTVAKSQHVEVVMNPAPAQKLPLEAYQAITHLIVNESEASIITGNERKSIDWAEPGEGWRALYRLGSQHITVTLGSRGVRYALCHDKEAELDIKSLDAKKVQVKDTTAAGDTFVGAYAVGIATNKSKDPKTMMRILARANEAAALTVAREGAQAAIPWADELPSLGAQA